MKVIGITGGVGAGKTTVLEEIAKLCKCRIITADLLAKKLQLPGEKCYKEVVSLLGKDVLMDGDNSPIDKKKMADKIFSDKKLLDGINMIIHPAVKQCILNDINKELLLEEVDFYFIEAALLIEEGYDVICDELWYIYADEHIRINRLMQSRGYTEEKAQMIMSKQCSDEIFRKYCKAVIDNSGDLNKTITDIKKALEG